MRPLRCHTFVLILKIFPFSCKMNLNRLLYVFTNLLEESTIRIVIACGQLSSSSFVACTSFDHFPERCLDNMTCSVNSEHPNHNRFWAEREKRERTSKKCSLCLFTSTFCLPCCLISWACRCRNNRSVCTPPLCDPFSCPGVTDDDNICELVEKSWKGGNHAAQRRT